MAKLYEIKHPLIEHKLSIIRDKDTSTKQFRNLVSEIGVLMTYEITRNLETYSKEIETPVSKMVVNRVKMDNLVIVPILRAGLGMVEGVQSVIPEARTGHIGIYRNEETLEAVEYFAKFPPKIESRQVIMVDPMLATGATAILAIDMLKKRGVTDIKFLCLVSCPEGVKALTEAHPDVDIYTAANDQKLNEHGYIVPGLGDAGDRIFGTL